MTSFKINKMDADKVNFLIENINRLHLFVLRCYFFFVLFFLLLVITLHDVIRLL